MKTGGFFVCFFLFSTFLFSQKVSISDEFLESTNDTTAILENNTISKNDTSATLNTPIDYQSTDSIVFDLKNNKIDLFGKSVAEYGDIKLNAYNISYDIKTSNIEAEGIEDSLGNKTENACFF